MAEIGESEWKEWRESAATKAYMGRLGELISETQREALLAICSGDVTRATCCAGKSDGFSTAIRLAEVAS